MAMEMDSSAATPTLIEMERWAIIQDFLPTSSQQVLAYCRSKGYEIPLARKPNAKGLRPPTTNDEALTRILMKHDDPVLEGVLRARHLKKAIGYLYDTYLGRDGRLHPIFTYTPKTGRLSSKAPNLMNLPQGRKGDIMAEAAQAIREAFIPPPGMLLVEFDWKNIEALLVGYFAEDADYMRLSQLGAHAYFTAFGVGKPADMTKSDKELLAYFDGIKKAYPMEYAQFKKANLSNNYGQGIRNMAKDLGVSITRAKEIRKVMSDAAPKVAAWKERIQRQAHKQSYLENPFGYRMNFFEVYKRDENGEWAPGKEANEVLAFPAQSSGAAMLRETLLTLGKNEKEDFYQLLIPTHDSVLLAAYEDVLDDVIEYVYRVMTKPWEELGGLSVEVEVKVGSDMRAMRGWSVTSGDYL